MSGLIWGNPNEKAFYRTFITLLKR